VITNSFPHHNNNNNNNNIKVESQAHQYMSFPIFIPDTSILIPSQQQQAALKMSPVAAPPPVPAQPGPHPSYIQVAKPFIFEQRLQGYIISLGGNPAREDSVRLQGVAWIDDVRRALQL